jgi:hypothetical protein
MPYYYPQITLLPEKFYADTPEQAEQFLEDYKEELAKALDPNGVIVFADYALTLDPTEERENA